MNKLSWTLIVIGSVGVWVAVGLEIMYQARIYELMMKIFPWVLGFGMLLHRRKK